MEGMAVKKRFCALLLMLIFLCGLAPFCALAADEPLHLRLYPGSSGIALYTVRGDTVTGRYLATDYTVEVNSFRKTVTLTLNQNLTWPMPGAQAADYGLEIQLPGYKTVIRHSAERSSFTGKRYGIYTDGALEITGSGEVTAMSFTAEASSARPAAISVGRALTLSGSVLLIAESPSHVGVDCATVGITGRGTMRLSGMQAALFLNDGVDPLGQLVTYGQTAYDFFSHMTPLANENVGHFVPSESPYGKRHTLFVGTTGDSTHIAHSVELRSGALPARTGDRMPLVLLLSAMGLCLLTGLTGLVFLRKRRG